MTTTPLRLQHLLVQQGLTTRARLFEALWRSQGTGATWLEVMILSGAVEEDVVGHLLASTIHLPLVEVEDIVHVPASALAALPPEVCAAHRVMPLALDDEGYLRVAMVDPTDDLAREEVTFFANRPVLREVALATTLAWALHHHLGLRTPLWPRLGRELRVQDSTGEEGIVLEMEVDEITRPQRLAASELRPLSSP